jgi:hypothetical protein
LNSGSEILSVKSANVTPSGQAGIDRGGVDQQPVDVLLLQARVVQGERDGRGREVGGCAPTDLSSVVTPMPTIAVFSLILMSGRLQG